MIVMFKEEENEVEEDVEEVDEEEAEEQREEEQEAAEEDTAAEEEEQVDLLFIQEQIALEVLEEMEFTIQLQVQQLIIHMEEMLEV